MVAKIDNKEALTFILAGNCTFTAQNKETENRFTFKVKKHKVDDVYFVSVLRGQCNTKDYTFFGSIIGNDFKLSKKATYTTDSQCVKVFNFIFNKLKQNSLPDVIEIYHEGTCAKCGRKLTTPESIKTGLGPECGKRVVSKSDIINSKLNQLLFK